MSYSCRICFDDDEIREKFIVPCECKGSAKYIHKECLNEWLKHNLSNLNYDRCNSCLFKYKRFSNDEIKINSMISDKYYIESLWTFIYLSITLIILGIICISSFIFAGIILFIFGILLWLLVIPLCSNFYFLIGFLIFICLFENVGKEKTKLKSIGILIISFTFIYYLFDGILYDKIIKEVKSNFRKDNKCMMYDNELHKYINGML